MIQIFILENTCFPLTQQIVLASLFLPKRSECFLVSYFFNFYPTFSKTILGLVIFSQFHAMNVYQKCFGDLVIFYFKLAYWMFFIFITILLLRKVNLDMDHIYTLSALGRGNWNESGHSKSLILRFKDVWQEDRWFGEMVPEHFNAFFDYRNM